MFFWNKYCGLALLLLSLNTNLFAQNLDIYQLTERSFLLGNISLTHESDDNMFLENSWLFKHEEYSGKSMSSPTFISSANAAINPENAGLPNIRALDNLFTFSSLNSYSETQPTKIIPSDFSTCQYGFFCRQEIKIEKATNLPLRVRLGSLQQCNYYEGKP